MHLIIGIFRFNRYRDNFGQVEQPQRTLRIAQSARNYCSRLPPLMDPCREFGKGSLTGSVNAYACKRYASLSAVRVSAKHQIIPCGRIIADKMRHMRQKYFIAAFGGNFKYSAVF